MDLFRRPLRRRATLAAGLLLAAAAAGASAASVGGGYWPALGPVRIAVKGEPASPVETVGNLRFDFDGSEADPAGTGTVVAYDEAGQRVISDFPFAWTTKKGASFRADLMGAEFEEFVAARIEEGAGGSAAVTLASATAKGRLHPRDGTLRVSVKAKGEATLDGGPPRKLRVKMKLK